MFSDHDLNEEDFERYEWQLSVRGFGEAGQSKLKKATVLISRIGGVGGVVAMQLAAAGVGRLILAHAGNIRLNDLNRQLLMTTESIGQPRATIAARTLHSLNPTIRIEAIPENICAANAAQLIQQCDVVVSAAPLFDERLTLNDAAVGLGKPLVDCAMYELEGRLMTVLPHDTACLRCLYATSPPNWKRQFPVFSAVSSTVGSLAAMEVIKLISGCAQPMLGRMLVFNLRDMSFRMLQVMRRSSCEACGNQNANPALGQLGS